MRGVGCGGCQTTGVMITGWVLGFADILEGMLRTFEFVYALKLSLFEFPSFHFPVPLEGPLTFRCLPLLSLCELSLTFAFSLPQFRFPHQFKLCSLSLSLSLCLQQFLLSLIFPLLQFAFRLPSFLPLPFEQAMLLLTTTTLMLLSPENPFLLLALEFELLYALLFLQPLLVFRFLNAPPPKIGFN